VRRRAGLTQAELARLIGRRWQSTVSAWERDGLRDPELAERILELLRHVATGNDCARQELAAARAALGWSRDRLARELGVSRRRVVAYEAGRRVVPDVTRAAVRSLASSAPPVLDAATLRARREALGLSQAVLARRAGLWQSQVHACEHGARLAPLLRARLWRALETTPPAADPRAARRERILALIAEHPGLSGKQILGRAATSWRDVLAALQELELGGQVHQRSEAYVDSTGRRRHRRGWQPGPAPTTRQHTPGAGDLRELRSVAGITLTELAAHLGVSAAALSRYERGIVPMPAPLCRDAHAIVAGAPRAVVVPTAVELRRVRRALGTSQGEFGRLLGVSRDTVGDWERRRPIPVSGWRAALERLSARVDAGDVRAIALSAALQQRH
jgi:transcriptional regulator with XRE-family HTH domain